MKFEKELVEIDNELVEIRKRLNNIAKELAKNIGDVLGENITYSIGWEEGGIETICFYLEHPKRKRFVECFLANVFREVYGDKFKEIKFESPFGIYITKREAERIKERIKKEHEVK